MAETVSAPTWRRALDDLVADLRALYGSRLNRVVLYGSRARGDAEETSDIDALVVLDPGGEFWEEFSRISPLADRLSLEYDVVVSAIPVSLRAYQEALSPLLLNVRREGLQVA